MRAGNVRTKMCAPEMCAQKCARTFLCAHIFVRTFPEILEKTSQSEPHPSPHLRKSWKKPRNLSPVLAPTAGTPGNPGKNLTICGPSPGPPEILEKTSQFADRRRDRRKSWKKTSQYYGFAWLLLVVGWLFRQAVQRPPVGAIIRYNFRKIVKIICEI